MSLKEVEPAPCMDKSCRQPHAPVERLALARQLCDGRGAQLTPLRRRILELLWLADRQLGAYELINGLN